MKDQTNDSYETWLSKYGGYASSMTLRDYFAAKAMQADIGANGWGGDVAHTVQQAWEVADAMLRARGDKQ